eukprot:767146-Hanusia_phi.AAC.2
MLHLRSVLVISHPCPSPLLTLASDSSGRFAFRALEPPSASTCASAPAPLLTSASSFPVPPPLSRIESSWLRIPSPCSDEGNCRLSPAASPVAAGHASSSRCGARWSGCLS